MAISKKKKGINEMRNHRFILLNIKQDFPLKDVKSCVYYRMKINGEEKRYAEFFILNGNIYLKVSVYKSACCDSSTNYYCCSIEKLRRFITKVNISQFFFKRRKKTELETVGDLYVMTMECGYKREIDCEEYYEAECELKSDYSNRYKFNDFNFVVSLELNPWHYPGDILISESKKNGSIITLDMISKKRCQPVPEYIKDEVTDFANNMLEENLIDIKDVQFLLQAELELYVIGTLGKTYRINVIMIDKNKEELHKKRFFIYDCGGKEAVDIMDEYFKNELFPGMSVKEE